MTMFSYTQEKNMERILLLKKELERTEITDEVCPLLKSDLKAIVFLCTRLKAAIRDFKQDS